MSVIGHVHKLKRHTYKNGSQVYVCILPDCFFKISPELALGKRCLCHKCNNEFILNNYSIGLAKPHCEKCHKRRDDVFERRKNPVMAAMANDNLQSLQDKLRGSSQIIKEIEQEPDDDLL